MIEFPWTELSRARPRLVVIGDVMLDRTVQGEARRLSPEAPVPVIHQRDVLQSPGGAANVAMNLAALGARVGLVGVVGDDAEAAELRAELRGRDVDVSGLAVVAGRPTTVKTRLVTHRQQVARLDREMTTPLTTAGARSLLSRLDREMRDCQAVLVPDYGKGVVTRAVWDALVAQAAARQVPVLVDPSPAGALDLYRGATGIKLNWAEARQAARLTGSAETEIEVAGRHVLKDTGTRWAVITRGEDGMSLFRPGADRIDIAARRREVFDVTGAGDTVLAVIGFALACGLELEPAARLANLAGGLVVEHLGTATVTLADLEDDARPEAELRRKIVDRDEMVRRVAQHRRAGRRVVFTNGCFDLLHAGHIRLLKHCARFGEVVVVGLNTDASVRRLKGEDRPFLPLDERAVILGALPEVSLVVPFDEDTPEPLIGALRPDVLVKGADYKVEEVVGRSLVEAAGGRVELAPVVKNVSSTGIARRIRSSGRQESGRGEDRSARRREGT